MGREFTGLVVSDEHIFDSKSRLKNGYSAEAIKAFGQYDFLIRAGDTYEFVYFFQLMIDHFLEEPHLGRKVTSSMPKDEDFFEEGKVHPALKERIKEAISDALALTTQLVGNCPNTHVIDILGNHDGCARYAKFLNEIAKGRANYSWDAEDFYIGDNGYVTHGDLPLRKKSLDQRDVFRMKDLWHARAEFHVEKAVHSIVKHCWFNFWNQKRLIVPRLHGSLIDNYPQKMAGVEHVFFGHVHTTPFCNAEHDGIRYHQGGASVNNEACKPLQLTIEADSEELIVIGNRLMPGAKIVNVEHAVIPGLSYDGGWLSRTGQSTPISAVAR